MNLVQIQERLKDLPTQALMQIANGGSPIAPPYLALGELKRRESIMQSAQGQQAMQQGQQPSVKEQVEKAAGLAGLQKQMQAQGMQSLMAQARPQGIPQNIPQPERQGESEGVAGLPTGEMYNFRNGGIVAFAKGGPSVTGQRESGETYGGEELIPIEQMQAEYMRLLRNQQFSSARQLADKIKARQETESKTVTMPIAQLGEDVKPVSQRIPAAPTIPEQPMAQPMGAPPATVKRGALPPPGAGVGQDLSLAGLKPGMMPTGAPPEFGAPIPLMPTAPTGIASIPGAEKASKMMLETMETKPTLEAEATEAEKARGLFGLTQPYGEERMKRIQEMQAARQQELEPRGMERLMRVMGGIAGRGLAGAGPAYLQSMESERAADAAFRKQMDELLGGVEEARRKEAMGTMTDAQKRKARKEEMAIGAAEKIMDADTKFKLQELQTKSVMGRLSSEDEYVRREIAKGRSYPEIKQELVHAGSLKEELKDTDLQKWAVQEAIKAWGDLGARENPNKLSQNEWIKQKAAEIYKLQKGMAGVSSAGAAVPDDIAPLLKKYGAK